MYLYLLYLYLMYQHVAFSDFEVSLAVNYHSAIEVHLATDLTLYLERTTTCRNRASAPTAQTCSLIEPTKSVPLLTERSWSLRCLSEARVISPWSPALPTLHFTYLQFSMLCFECAHCFRDVPLSTVQAGHSFSVFRLIWALVISQSSALPPLQLYIHSIYLDLSLVFWVCVLSQ